LTQLSGDKGSGKSHEAQLAKLEDYVKGLEASLRAQLKAQKSGIRPSERLDDVIETIGGLTMPAQALARAIRNYHLSKAEYSRLSATDLGQYLSELRAAGLLVPVVHHSDHGSEPCYYFPSGTSKIIRTALQMLPAPPPEIRRDVAEELRRVGYIRESDGENRRARAPKEHEN
jgi:hypothetical protein